MNNLDKIIKLFSGTLIEKIEAIILIVIILCVIVIVFSIFINFIEARTKIRKKHEKKSIVETGSMFLFFLFYYLIIRFNLGRVYTENIYIQLIFILIGLILIITGTLINILGRLKLGKNWANQVVIYNDQTFVKSGPYKIIRHPLYGSLIMIFYGGCLVYFNLYAFFANTFVFIPFMYYRAKQEEELLIKQFKNYKNYIKEVGMFFPKVIK